MWLLMLTTRTGRAKFETWRSSARFGVRGRGENQGAQRRVEASMTPRSAHTPASWASPNAASPNRPTARTTMVSRAATPTAAATARSKNRWCPRSTPGRAELPKLTDVANPRSRTVAAVWGTGSRPDALTTSAAPTAITAGATLAAARAPWACCTNKRFCFRSTGARLARAFAAARITEMPKV